MAEANDMPIKKQSDSQIFITCLKGQFVLFGLLLSSVYFWGKFTRLAAPGFGYRKLLASIIGVFFLLLACVKSNRIEKHVNKIKLESIYLGSIVAFLISGLGVLVLFPLNRTKIENVITLFFIGIIICSGFSILVSRKLNWSKVLFIHFAFLTYSFAIFKIGDVVASLFTPSWPARDLRPIRVAQSIQYFPQVNSWGLRDEEHSFKKERKRIVFLGDSFLEGGPNCNALSQYVRAMLQGNNTELINLGVSATGPEHYFYRMKRIGITLSPDEVFLFFYEGNDYMDDYFNPSQFSLLRELPLPSLMAFAFPNFSWHLVNIFGISEYGLGIRQAPAQEQETLNRISKLGEIEFFYQLSTHIHRYYFPDIDRLDIEEKLKLGGNKLWKLVHEWEVHHQLLQGWAIKRLLHGIYYSNPTPPNLSEVENLINSTVSHLLETSKLLKKSQIKLRVYMIPVAEEVDSDFVDYWSEWNPQIGKRVVNLRGDLLEQRLKENGLYVKRLNHVLASHKSTYNLIDAHWNQNGHRIISQFIMDEINK